MVKDKSAHAGRGARERMLRIIAGQWRGRRWRFPPEHIRPTPDRVRETLFNWLQTRIEGAHCLDLYAGSGALGLEALSRGAAAVTFVEHNAAAAAALRALLSDWGASAATLHREDAQQYLSRAPLTRGYDLVFLDPPFDSGELPPVCRRLAAGWLCADARIYVEHARAAMPPALPAHWHELRTGVAGEVGYHLYAAAPAPTPVKGATA